MNLKIATDLEASFSLCKLFFKTADHLLFGQKVNYRVWGVVPTPVLPTKSVNLTWFVGGVGFFSVTWLRHNCFNFEPTDNSDNGLFLFASRSLLNGHTKMTQGKSFWKSPGSWGNVFTLWLNFYKVENVVKVELKLLLEQGCINCGILVSGIRARGVSSEHMENMEMFSCSPT